MAIIKWSPMLEPFEEMDKMISDFMPSLSKGFMPAVDVYQDKDNVYVESPLAGIEPKDIDISIENDVLTMKGEMEKKTEVDEKNYYRKEVRRGEFYRSVSLPTHVVGDKANADYEKGVLKITIPKAPEAKPKTIKVNVK
ncbi:MAG: Hsp20/alpha crystallin family protein [bacterium]